MEHAAFTRRGPEPRDGGIRILFAGQSLGDPTGGGELSARALLGALAQRTHVQALGVGRIERSYVLDEGIECRDVISRWLPASAGIPFHLAALGAERGFGRILAEQLRSAPPDLLLLQQPAWVPPSAVPRDSKLVVFLRSPACYGIGEPNPFPLRRTLSRPFGSIRYRANRALLERADLLVTNSAFLQEELARRRGLSSHVVPPFIDTGALRRDSVESRAGEWITFVGLDEWKGAALAIRIARTLPERRFLFLDGARPSARMISQAERLPNVTRQRWTDDMADVFRRTRLLLVPSLWEEPFGRLPVEAGCLGIPTLASSRGGLPDSVGEGGLVLDALDDVEPWVRSIRRLDDPEHYDALSRAARENASRYTLEASMTRFEDLLRKHAGLSL